MSVSNRPVAKRISYNRFHMICNKLTMAQCNRIYDDVLRDGNGTELQRLCKEDLFFLISRGFKRMDLNDQWIYERVREVEREPDGNLDLWAREHYKSTIITYGLTIKDILNDPDITVGIFSHTRPIAKAFMEQIKREFEENKFLIGLFPEILYSDPKKDSPKWSMDGGIVVKRKTNPKESTVEAWGLVDSSPVSKHFSLLLYDDVVTKESVTTPEQIEKTTTMWELSLDLGSRGGKKRYIGTRYHHNDTWAEIIKRRAARPRIHAATKNGKWPGEPVLLTMQQLEEKRRDQGPYTFSSQQLLNPTADKAMGFHREWLQFYDILKVQHIAQLNKYILVDPASKKKKENDYTVIAVVGLGPDNNYYLIDAVRDRLNLTERTNKLFEFHRKYKPLNVGYEQYGMQCDIEHIEYVQAQEGYRFKITPLAGISGKNDRILRLVPLFENERFWLPHTLNFIDYERKLVDFVQVFTDDEYLAFPVAVHDDMLDCLSRIVDVDLLAKFPENVPHVLKSITIGQSTNKVETDYDVLG